MVAKIPLLISSRMTSAGLTASSSASSLTVIVAGSSIAPRSRGSATCTCDSAPVSRRGGLRGPRRPRVPLLLLATHSSFGVQHRRSRQERLAELHGDRGLQRPRQRASLHGPCPAVGVAAEVCPPPGQPTSFVDHQFARRRPDDPDEITLLPRGPTGHARARRDATRRRSPPLYDATSLVAVFLARGFFAGATVPSPEPSPAAIATGSGAGSASAPVPSSEPGSVAASVSEAAAASATGASAGASAGAPATSEASPSP